jgi:single-strand DNA-binding protein
MSGYINKAILVGRLGKDPQVRITQDGAKVVTLYLATSEMWRNRESGEEKERTEWHRIVIFQPRLCDVAERILRKGQMVYVEGQIQSRKWTDQNNQEHNVQEVVIRYKGDIQLLSSRAQDSNEPRPELPAPLSSEPGPGMQGFDDEIPF